jgi:hypothetical protein
LVTVAPAPTAMPTGEQPENPAANESQSSGSQNRDRIIAD